jgi:hypothetical protein
MTIGTEQMWPTFFGCFVVERIACEQNPRLDLFNLNIFHFPCLAHLYKSNTMRFGVNFYSFYDMSFYPKCFGSIGPSSGPLQLDETSDSRLEKLPLLILRIIRNTNWAGGTYSYQCSLKYYDIHFMASNDHAILPHIWKLLVKNVNILGQNT